MTALCLPEPLLAEVDGLVVVRDDLLPGGTKTRALPVLLDGPAPEVVYASPAAGYAQLAVALTARALGKRATIFTAQRRMPHALTQAARQAGAHVVPVPAGYLSVVTARARAYCAVTGAQYLPFGLDCPVFLDALAAVARALPVQPAEVWAVAGSGVLIRALQRAWPRAQCHAVRIGAAPHVGPARLYQAPERFEQPAQAPPPFPSCPTYDAKAWRFVRQHARPGALFWNVAS